MKKNIMEKVMANLGHQNTTVNNINILESNERNRQNTVQEYCEYFNDIERAINNVESQYRYWDDINPQYTKKHMMQERVFCYEFYHQFRNIMEMNEQRYKDLLLNGEIKKCERSLNSKKYHFPDFVLHTGNEDCLRQELVIEVKTKMGLNSSNLLYDIRKLSYFTHDFGDANFKAGLFIAVNMNNNDLEEMLKRSRCLKNENTDRIFCIGTASNPNSSIIETLNLNKVLGKHVGT